MTCRILLMACCGALVLASPLAAQQASLRPHPSSLFVAPATVAADSLHLPPTYWKEGALIGGVPMAVLGGLAFHGLCEWNDESGDANCAAAAAGGALFSGILGAIVGALIGGQFHKKE